MHEQSAARRESNWIHGPRPHRGIRALRALAVLALAFWCAMGCRPEKPAPPEPPRPLVFKGRGFTVPLPLGFTGMAAEQTRVFSALGGAALETYIANSNPLILEVHAITPDGDPREIFGAVRNADYSDFLPGLYKADVRLFVEPRRAPENDSEQDRDQALARLARMLVTADAARAVRDILGPALPPEQAVGLERRIVVQANEAENFLTLTVSGDDPEQCRAVAGAYGRFLQSRNGRYMDHVIAFLNERIEENKKSMDWYHDAVSTYHDDYKVRTPDVPPNQVDLLINALELDRASAMVDLVTAHAQLFETRRLAPGAPDPSPDEMLRQYSGFKPQAPPSTVTSKTESVNGAPDPKIPPEERINQDLAALELERRILMAGRMDTPPEAVKLADSMAAKTRELDKLIREQVESRFNEKQPESAGDKSPGAADTHAPKRLPPELREKLLTLELAFALDKARYERLDRNTREYKKNRAIASGLDQELLRLVRERQTMAALGDLYRARLRALNEMSAGSPDKVEVRDPPAASAKPALPRGAGLPPVFSHLQGGVVIDKKEPAILGGREAVVMRCTMPWNTGRDVFTYQALVPAGDKIYWLRAIAVQNNALDDPGVVRFFKEFSIKEK